MPRQPKLVVAIKEILERNRLASDLSAQLEVASASDLRAVQAVLLKRSGMGRPGAKPKYSSEYLKSVRNAVEREGARLKAAGARRHGAKTAIRSLIESAVRAQEGEHALTAKRRQIKAVFDELRRAHDAARKRG